MCDWTGWVSPYEGGLVSCEFFVDQAESDVVVCYVDGDLADEVQSLVDFAYGDKFYDSVEAFRLGVAPKSIEEVWPL